MKLHAKNILSLLMGDVAVRVLGFIATVYLARVLGSESYGTINFGMAVLSYGLLCSSPGLHIIGTKFISRKNVNEQRFIYSITSTRFFLAIAACVFVYVLSFMFIHNEQLRITSILFSFSLLPMASHIEWYFQGKENISAVSVGKFSWSLLYTIGILLFITSHNDFRIVPIVFFAAVSIQAIILFVQYKKQLPVEKIPTPSDVHFSRSELLKISLPLGSATIIAQAFITLPTILLGFFSFPSDIANYSIASKLVFFVLAIDRIMYMLFFPFVARLHYRSPKTLQQYMPIIFKYIIIVCLPITVGGGILAKPLLLLIFGAQYSESAVLLQILLWYFLFTILNSFFLTH